MNIRGELRKATAEGCTTYVIGRRGTANGEILIGQNSDMGQQNIELGYILHLKPKNKPQVLIWTFGGMIGYHGMNSAGVAIFENALSEARFRARGKVRDAALSGQTDDTRDFKSR